MSKVLWNTPFCFFAAWGLFSLSTGAGVMDLDSALEGWLEIWRSITRPVWSFLLWPLEYHFDFVVPWWVKDYLSMSVIAGGVWFRYLKALRAYMRWVLDLKLEVALGLLCGVLWPVSVPFLVKIAVSLANGEEDHRRYLKSEIGPMSERDERFLDSLSKKWVATNKVALGTIQETAIWFILIIAMNYALLFKDGELRWSELF